MFLLGLYLFIALFFSFLCSIAEAVLLSVNQIYIAMLEKEGKKSGAVLRMLKADINKPLTAILTLNTVAHTIGAAGVGAQATAVFGDASLGVVSAVLTFLILVFSEIIPKTLGASYWRALAPATAYCLKFMVWALYPFVKMSEYITRHLVDKESSSGFARDEMAVMAQLSAEEGHIDSEEAEILQNILRLKDSKIMEAISPWSVVFYESQKRPVEAFFHKHKKMRFSRIPVYQDEPENIVGYVMRDDLLVAQARGNTDVPLSNYLRKMPTFLDNMTLSHALKEFVSGTSHIALVVNEYGTIRGILTLEDVLEALIGREIVDEDDKHVDMQKEASRKWRSRAKKEGIKLDPSE